MIKFLRFKIVWIILVFFTLLCDAVQFFVERSYDKYLYSDTFYDKYRRKKTEKRKRE